MLWKMVSYGVFVIFDVFAVWYEYFDFLNVVQLSCVHLKYETILVFLVKLDND